MKEPIKTHIKDEKVTAPATEKPDGPKEWQLAIRSLISRTQAEKQSGTTIDALDKISHYLDLLEGKPEALEAEKAWFAKTQEAKAEKAKADAAQAKEDAKASV
jgi:hypothetical protein